MIFIHELGHFIAAKLMGVKVNEFAIGFGPTLFKKQGKETLYAVRAVPFGGFCAMEGEEETSSDSRAFCNKKIPPGRGGIFIFFMPVPERNREVRNNRRRKGRGLFLS